MSARKVAAQRLRDDILDDFIESGVYGREQAVQLMDIVTDNLVANNVGLVVDGFGIISPRLLYPHAT